MSEPLEGLTDSESVPAGEAGQPGESSAPQGASQEGAGESELSPELQAIVDARVAEVAQEKYEGPEGDIAATKRTYAAKEREKDARIAELEAQLAQQSTQRLDRVGELIDQGDSVAARAELEAVQQQLGQQQAAATAYQQTRAWAENALAPMEFDLADPDTIAFLEEWVPQIAQDRDGSAGYTFLQQAAVRRVAQEAKARKQADKKAAELEAGTDDEARAKMQRKLVESGAVHDMAGPGRRVHKNPLEGQTAPGPLLEDAFAEINAKMEEKRRGRK
jgi:hypothetical protein